MAFRLLPMAALALISRASDGQGITTAGVEGTVAAVDGSPVASATVQLTNAANGRTWTLTTNGDGRFLHATVGVGTYRIDVRALGFAPQSQTGIVLVLGQPLVTGFRLVPLAVGVAPVTVMATRHPVLDADRTGPTDVIAHPTIASLPNLGRGFLNLALLSPQVVFSARTPATATASGIAFDGQNRVYNSFQIDGGMHQDLYRGQLPGRESLPRPLSLEAIEEIQVLAAPFDVRHGGFAGGLVNAVTKSGTNAVEGSLFAYLSDAALVRRGGTGGSVGDFRTWQFGGTVGGPIVRDRAHYFLSVDVQRRVVPDPGPFITDTIGGADVGEIGIPYASAARFQTILDTLYGIDAGTLGPVDGHVPAQDVFGKITVELARNNHVEWSFHHLRGDRRDFLLRTRNYYALSSLAQAEPSTTGASRVVWTSILAGWANELIIGYLGQRDSCRPASLFPELIVTTSVGASVTAGTPRTCAASSVRQEALEVTNNAARAIGRHVVGVGIHGELLRFRDDLATGSPGLWMFDNLDALEAGRARIYQRTLRGPVWAGGIDFPAHHVALYAQDRWSPVGALTLTAGVRVDLPTLPDPIPTNEALVDALGHDTGARPTGNALWSPRVGINYDIGARGHTFLRGGAGLFAGRPPYRWLSNAYRDDGTRELYLDCRGPQAPIFVPMDQPESCVSTGPLPRLSFFDPGVAFPQNLKVSLGVDRRLADSVVGTVDVLFTRAVHQLHVTDANLAAPSGVSAGEGNRPLYGTIDPTSGAARPTRTSAAFGQVVRVGNTTGDRSLSISGQLRMRVGEAISGHALYSYTRARDRMSLVHIAARAMLEGTVLDGTHEQRRLGTSLFEIPHRVQVTTGVRLPYGVRLGLLYAGSSGRPFTFTVHGDANGDGLGVVLRQDPVYVPRGRADMAIDGNGAVAGAGTVVQQDSAYADLDAFIESVPCLRAQRGRIVARNSCRNPWFGTLNARLTKVFPTAAGQSVEIAADVYNVLNMLSSRWGLARHDGLTFATDLLVLRGYDTMAGRGVYEFRPPPRNQVDDLASRWQMEVSVRYRF